MKRNKNSKARSVAAKPAGFIGNVQFLKDCAKVANAHPSVICVEECADGIIVTFKAKAPDSHNYDFNPMHAEWVAGQFPSKDIGAIHVKSTGYVEFVGEDAFIGSYYLKHAVELPDLLDFYANARKYTKLKITYHKQLIGSLFKFHAKGEWTGLVWLDGAISTLCDNTWVPPYKGRVFHYVPIIPTTDMPLTFLCEYFIYYPYGNQELGEAVYNRTEGYHYIEPKAWKDTMLTIPATRAQQLLWAVQHRMLRVWQGRRMEYDIR